MVKQPKNISQGIPKNDLNNPPKQKSGNSMPRYQTPSPPPAKKKD